MNKIIYDRELMWVMDLLGKLSRAKIKDCFKEEDTYYFVVEKGEVGKAIGKGAVNVKKLRQKLNKNIKVVEYGSTASEFVRKFIFPLKVEEISEEDGVVSIKSEDRKIKGLLVGRDGKNLKLLNKAVKRYFDVEVKVV